jgi:hypothetical protein
MDSNGTLFIRINFTNIRVTAMDLKHANVQTYTPVSMPIVQQKYGWHYQNYAHLMTVIHTVFYQIKIFHLPLYHLYIMDIYCHVIVTIDGVWIGNRIYWPLTDRNYALSLIHIFGSSLQHVLSLLSLLCLHRSFPCNGLQRRIFPLLWVPELSPCLSYQLLTATARNDWTAVLKLTNSPTNSSLPCTALTFTNCPVYNISSRSAQRTPFLLLLNCCLVDPTENTVPLLHVRNPVVVYRVIT